MIDKGGHIFIFEHENGFDKRRCPGRDVKMADIALYGADSAGLPPRSVKSRAQAREFDGIAEIRAGAVSLDIAYVRIAYGCGSVRHAYDFRLALDAGRGVTGLSRAVIVDSIAAYDRPDMIASVDGIPETAQKQRADALAHDRAVGGRVKRAAMPVGRKNPARLRPIAPVPRAENGSGDDQGKIATVVQEVLAA